MKTMMKLCCLMMTVLLCVACFAGCSSAPAEPSGDTNPTGAPSDGLTAEEQDVFGMLDLVDELALGVKDTKKLAVMKAAALLDRCEQTAVSVEVMESAAKKYYAQFGSSFGMMFDEKLRLVSEACTALRDEATRAQQLQEAGAASTTAWTNKAFDAVDAMVSAIKG